jgi:DNA repair protein RadA
MSEIQRIKGLGEKKAEKLEEKGITTIEQVSIMQPEELKAILGTTLKAAKDIIASAKDLSKDSIQILTGEELYNERKKSVKRIPTGSVALDSILGGGVPTNAITGLFGKFASSKSQLCYQLMVFCKKYLNRKIAFIETEPSTLDLDRILALAKYRGVDLSLRDILVVPAKFIDTPTHLFKAYQFIHQKILSGEDIGLLIVDSFNAPFRTVFTGREMLPARSAESGRHIGFLQMLARKYNMAIVLTLQVMGVPDTTGQYGAIRDYGITYLPVGSHIVKHGVNYWIALERVSSKSDEGKGSKAQLFKAILVDGPMPRDEALFMLDEIGIRDPRRGRGV